MDLTLKHLVQLLLVVVLDLDLLLLVMVYLLNIMNPPLVVAHLAFQNQELAMVVPSVDLTLELTVIVPIQVRFILSTLLG